MASAQGKDASEAGGVPHHVADPATLRRGLELVLGGPPGFTTGARAEILADLLQEFGAPTMIGIIRRDWVTQFDTGPDASGSVSKSSPP